MFVFVFVFYFFVFFCFFFTDLTSKASQTHSALMGGHDLPLPPSGPSDFPPFQPPPHVAGMRMRPLPPGHTPPKVRDMASAGMMYPHYSVPMSHGEVKN